MVSHFIPRYAWYLTTAITSFTEALILLWDGYTLAVKLIIIRTKKHLVLIILVAGLAGLAGETCTKRHI